MIQLSVSTKVPKPTHEIPSHNVMVVCGRTRGGIAHDLTTGRSVQKIHPSDRVRYETLVEVGSQAPLTAVNISIYKMGMSGGLTG